MLHKHRKKSLKSQKPKRENQKIEKISRNWEKSKGVSMKVKKMSRSKTAFVIY